MFTLLFIVNLIIIKILVAETEGHSNIKVGDTVKVGFPSNRCHLFDSSNQAFK